jgi:hypothetical protein
VLTTTASTTTSTAPSTPVGQWWGDYIILGASVIAALGVIGVLVSWATSKFHSVVVSYTDETLLPSVELFTKTIGTNEDSDVFVRVFARRSIEFSEIQVRPLQKSYKIDWGSWRFWKRRGFSPHKIFNAVPRDVLRVVALEDAETDWIEGAHSPDDWPQKLFAYVFPDHDPRGGALGRFRPVFTRLAGEAIILKITLHAKADWCGSLGFYLPSGNRRRYWVRLPLAATQRPLRVPEDRYSA